MPGLSSAKRVKDFLETLAPVPRRKLWGGLKGLAQDEGDIKQLEGKLAPYWRFARGSVARDLRTEIGGGPAAVGLFLRGSPGYGLCRAGAIARVRLGGRVEAVRACMQTPSKLRVRASGLQVTMTKIATVRDPRNHVEVLSHWDPPFCPQTYGF